MFSEALSKAIVETLSEGNQTILYLNRRGHSSFVFCRVCGQSIDCSKCKISLVYHSSSTILRCHYCGEARSIPKQCPSCTSTAIKFFGAGTQRIEAEAKRYFPQARIQRMDSDTVGPKGNMEEILNAFGNKEIDILIGTQMVAKGLDFPHVTLVGILAADSLLRIPDFRATERNFSLLAQVSGRSGRGGSPGKVVLQTYFPEHFSIKHALSENYRGFFDEEMQHRREGRFPPFFHLAAFLLCSENSQKVREVSQKLAKALSEHSELKTQEILGPAPAPIERINNQFRFRLLVKSTDLISMTSAIREVLDQFPTSGIKLSVDIDPIFSL